LLDIDFKLKKKFMRCSSLCIKHIIHVLMKLMCCWSSFNCGWKTQCASWRSRMLCQRSKHHTTVSTVVVMMMS